MKSKLKIEKPPRDEKALADKVIAIMKAGYYLLRISDLLDLF